MHMYMNMCMFLIMFMLMSIYVRVDVHEHLLYVHLLCTCSCSCPCLFSCSCSCPCSYSSTCSLTCSCSFMFMFMITDKDIGIHTMVKFVLKIIKSETKQSSSTKKCLKRTNVRSGLKFKSETKRRDSIKKILRRKNVRFEKKIFWRWNEKRSWIQKFPKQAKSFVFEKKKFVSKTIRSISILIYWENVKMFVIFRDKMWKTKDFDTKRSKVWHY